MLFESKFVKIKHTKCNFLNGLVQVNFYGLRFRLNRFKHSVKRFGRFGLDTLVHYILTFKKVIKLEKKNDSLKSRTARLKPFFYLYLLQYFFPASDVSY